MDNPFLAKAVKFFAFSALLTPLIVSRLFYFPYVGPKGIFFMALAELAFFSWLLLAIKDKNYRPKINLVFLSFAAFLAVMAIATFLSIDPSRSFWSKFERMAGLLMWLHLFGYFLAIYSTFRKEDYERFFSFSAAIASFIAVGAIGELAKIKLFTVSKRGGFTIGNSSFLGAYLLLNFFPTMWLTIKSKKLFWKGLFSVSLIFLFLATMLSGARAATISIVFGVAIIGLLWLSFQSKKKALKIIGKSIIALLVIVSALSVVSAMQANGFIHKKLEKLGFEARFINWKIAENLFKEKPILGWGPETYTITFQKYFNPCLFTSRCGGEPWFDRSHNIIFDTLTTTGTVGLVSYLFIFFAIIATFWKKYRENRDNFAVFSIFTALLLSYFLQNLTVFDMPTSLIMFSAIIAFGAYCGNSKKLEENKEYEGKKKLLWLYYPTIIFFALISLLKFVYQPYVTGTLAIKAVSVNNPQEKVKLYEKIFKGSPLGKYQMADFLAEDLIVKSRKQAKKYPRKEIIQEFKVMSARLEKLISQSPLDFRLVLRMANLYNSYYLFDQSKLELAKKYSKEALEMAPNNQQAYWVLIQTYIYSNKPEEALKLAEKSIKLEPHFFRSYKIAASIAKIFGRKEKLKEILEEAAKNNPDWKNKLNSLN